MDIVLGFVSLTRSRVYPLADGREVSVSPGDYPLYCAEDGSCYWTMEGKILKQNEVNVRDCGMFVVSAGVDKCTRRKAVVSSLKMHIDVVQRLADITDGAVIPHFDVEEYLDLR